MSATLAGVSISKARVHRVRHGLWTAEVHVTEPRVLSGRVELVVGDWTASGAIVSGGPVEGVASYLVVAGAGGWERVIPAKPYRNGAGVKLSDVLTDAAREAGEQLELGVADRSIGTTFLRQRGQAWDVLSLLAGPWWADDDGVTHVRERPSPVVTAKFDSVKWSRWSGNREISTEAIAAFAPGALLEGEPIEEVRIDVDAGAIRLHVRTTPGMRAMLAGLWRQELAKLGVLTCHEYRVKSQAGAMVDLQILRKTAGLPDAPRVRARPAAAGYSATYHAGSIVLVSFVRGDPTRPFIAHGDETGLPDEVVINSRGDILMGAGAASVIRSGDTISVTPGNGGGPVAGIVTITSGTAETPPADSRVKA